jgi:hypothetical protein
VDSYTDWENNGTYPIEVSVTTKFYVPASCCEDNAGVNNTYACRTNPAAYEDALVGCFKEFENIIDENSKNILAVGVAIVVIMVSLSYCKFCLTDIRLQIEILIRRLMVPMMLSPGYTSETYV